MVSCMHVLTGCSARPHVSAAAVFVFDDVTRAVRVLLLVLQGLPND